jgi:hypothetical protein
MNVTDSRLCKFASKLQKEFLQMLDESVFQFTLRIFVLEVQKLENEGVANVVVGGDLVIRLRPGYERAPGSLRPFIELGSDLPIQLADGPAAAKRFALVVRPGSPIPHGQQANLVRPGKWERRKLLQLSGRCLDDSRSLRLSRRCLDNLKVRQIELAHLENVTAREAAPKLRCKI